MKKTEYNDCSSIYSVVETMYSDAVSYFKPQNSSLFCDGYVKHIYHEQIDEANSMIRDGAPSADIFVRCDGSLGMHRTDSPFSINGVVFRYEIRLNARMLFDVVRYDYRDEVDVQKDIKKEEYGVEYKGSTYVFHNAYERDFVESMSQLIKHNGDEGVSGTDFGNMIKYVFRLLDVKSNWKLRW